MPVQQERGSLLKALCIVKNKGKGWKEGDERHFHHLEKST